MKTLYLDLGMGAAGDMLTAALYELLGENEKKLFLERLKGLLNEKGVTSEVEESVKCGITGTHFRFFIDGVEEHSHDHHDHDHTHGDDHQHDHGHHDHEHMHDEYGHNHDHDGHHHDHDHIHDDHGHYDHEHTHDEHGHGHHHDNDDHWYTHDEHGHDHDHGSHHHDHDHIHDDHGHYDHEHTHDEHHHDHEHAHGEHHHDHHGHHHHTSMQDIRDMVGGFEVSDKVRSDILDVYNMIAEAESSVHGKTVDEIHFHEVGTMDAVADVTAVCILMDMLSPDRVVASAVNTGFGKVRCMHGILPVPAPATAHILKGIPAYGGRIEGELCTPTGAALIKRFVNQFGSMPIMAVDRIGYGMGSKDFEAANCVRAVIGEEKVREDIAADSNADNSERCSTGTSDAHDTCKTVCSLECNIDDMTGEELGFAKEELMKSGALDVFSTPVSMKKGRPGELLTVICKTDDKERMAGEIFRLTSTIGIREKICERYILDRKACKINTPYGEITVKTVSGYGVHRSKIEYEDLRKIADSEGVSIAAARKIAERCIAESKTDD